MLHVLELKILRNFKCLCRKEEKHQLISIKVHISVNQIFLVLHWVRTALFLTILVDNLELIVPNSCVKEVLAPKHQGLMEILPKTSSNSIMWIRLRKWSIEQKFHKMS